ncbi:MAG TPA: signal peptidase II [Nitrospira sp.]|nr:signal peptidase II [Nitrospira sp. NTP1]HQR13223.1 signal peptidase II [Nitrospira sp.]HQV11034.1 signal peptidase II [Nitrospira sp.]
MSQSIRYLLLGLLSLAIVVVDQVTKVSVMETMRLHESIPVIANFFSITYIRNPGAAFGFLSSSSSSFRFVFFGLTSVFAVGLLAMIMVRMPKEDWMGRLSVAGILGGAVGNLLDRLRYGEVIDFLDFYLNGYHWPAFNVADSAITVGVVFLILHFATEKEPEDHPVVSGQPPS